MTLTFKDRLADGFDGPDFAPAGGLYYKGGIEQSAGTVTFEPGAGMDGGGALRLSVRRMPVAGQPANFSERAEVWERSKLRVPYTAGVWYGFAVKFADPIPQDDNRYLIAQWKREINHGHPLDFSPFLALRLSRGKLFATVETNYHRPPESVRYQAPELARTLVPVKLRPETNQMRALVATPADWNALDERPFKSRSDKLVVIDRGNPMPDPASGWIDFAIYTRPGPGGTGHVEIFANRRWVVTVRGHIGHDDAGLGERQYFKFGPYRAAGPAADWTLYFDDFRRSLRCDEVLRGAGCPF